MHGTTEKAALLLNEWIEGEVHVVDLKRDQLLFDITKYDTVIIGGSIHDGEIQPRISLFMEKNHDILMTKKLGLFLCCWYDGLEAKDQFNTVFPKAFREKAIANGIFGGELLISKMGFIEKQIAEYIGCVITDTSHFNPAAIEIFSKEFNKKFALV